MKRLGWVPVLLVLSLAGCVSPGRVADLKDCGMLSLGGGVGLSPEGILVAVTVTPEMRK